jgi:hypothetical protein
MGVFIDRIEEYPAAFVAPKLRPYGTLWCHLWADGRAELHAFAERLGLGRGRFHDAPSGAHYDLTPAERLAAVAAGAVAADYARWREAKRAAGGPG